MTIDYRDIATKHNKRWNLYQRFESLRVDHQIQLILLYRPIIIWSEIIYLIFVNFSEKIASCARQLSNFELKILVKIALEVYYVQLFFKKNN